MTEAGLAFTVETPPGFRVSCSLPYWQRISTIKHPSLHDRLADVIQTLVDPDEVRRSVSDAAVLLFHRSVPPRWMCAVVRRTDMTGFLITAYPADKVKSGGLIWTK